MSAQPRQLSRRSIRKSSVESTSFLINFSGLSGLIRRKWLAPVPYSAGMPSRIMFTLTLHHCLMHGTWNKKMLTEERDLVRLLFPPTHQPGIACNRYYGSWQTAKSYLIWKHVKHIIKYASSDLCPIFVPSFDICTTSSRTLRHTTETTRDFSEPYPTRPQ